MADAPLKARVLEDTKRSMKDRDKPRVAALRLIAAAIKQREVDERRELDDAQIIAVLDKMAKQRRESIEQYQQAARQDLVDQETFELNIIQDYLPAALSEAEIESLISAAIAQTGAQSARDMGKVMSLLKPQVLGRTDMAALSGRVKSQLA
ncbi:MAG: GatB/YqeY domain-containing protein [Gammaproteobacteria bacterium]|nr:GatB/YqeY domain-containing protein [Gammaproteobacteria bacterium]